MTVELTHEEAKALAASSEDTLEVIRRTEAAVIAKLAEGVSVGYEPFGEIVSGRGPAFAAYRLEDRPVRLGQQLYSLKQLRAAVAAARVQAIRDALNCYSPDDTATDWVDKIRALIGGAK